MGVDAVEIDIAETKDGHLIVMHDKTLDRTTNGNGVVKKRSLEELKQLVLKDGLGRKTTHILQFLRSHAVKTLKNWEEHQEKEQVFFS